MRPGRYLDVEITLVHAGWMVMPGPGASRRGGRMRRADGSSSSRAKISGVSDRRSTRPGRQDLRDGPVELRPRHPRAAVQPFGAQQQHDGLRIHADVGPLGRAQVPVDVAKQGGGRAEAVPVRGSGPPARLQALARNAERAVALLTEGGATLAVRGLQRGRYRSSRNSPWPPIIRSCPHSRPFMGIQVSVSSRTRPPRRRKAPHGLRRQASLVSRSVSFSRSPGTSERP